MKLNSIVYSGTLVLALTITSLRSQAHEQDFGDPPSDADGAIYTMDNSAAGNHILSFSRGADGTLRADGSFATGGLGSGSGLASQGAVVLSANGHWLFACDAGSDEISVFLVTPRGLVLTDKISSQGKHPVSLALHRNFVFVLNAGGQVGAKDSIAGFLFFAGKLLAMPHNNHSLSADSTNPAEINFSPDGEVLVVTEKDRNVIDTFTVDNDGSVDEAKSFQSAGQTPFGFAFRKNDLIVSEAFGGAANASAASSYDLRDDGALKVTVASVGTTETSACWVVVTENGQFAYTANTGSRSISGYRISPNGGLSLLNADGVTGNTGTGPADMALSTGSKFLYSRNGDGTISEFRVNANGSLTGLGSVAGLPAGATGLAGR